MLLLPAVDDNTGLVRSFPVFDLIVQHVAGTHDFGGKFRMRILFPPTFTQPLTVLMRNLLCTGEFNLMT